MKLEMPACWHWKLPRTPAPPPGRDGTPLYEWFSAWHAGRCALCDRVEYPSASHVMDHDHATGLVRGLLCRSCNSREAHADTPLLRRYRAWSAARWLDLELPYWNHVPQRTVSPEELRKAAELLHVPFGGFGKKVKKGDA